MAAYAFTRGWDIAAGLSLALGIACKVTPALFLPYLVWKRAWKTLAATAAEGGLDVIGVAFKDMQRSTVIPSTHWNIEEMRQPAMFSTETGAMLPIAVTDLGVEKVKTGEGVIDARKFLVKSELTAAFWYDASGRWVKCAFEAQGSKVEYVLRRLPG